MLLCQATNPKFNGNVLNGNYFVLLTAMELVIKHLLLKAVNSQLIVMFGTFLQQKSEDIMRSVLKSTLSHGCCRFQRILSVEI